MVMGIFGSDQGFGFAELIAIIMVMVWLLLSPLACQPPFRSNGIFRFVNDKFGTDFYHYTLLEDEREHQRTQPTPPMVEGDSQGATSNSSGGYSNQQYTVCATHGCIFKIMLYPKDDPNGEGRAFWSTDRLKRKKCRKTPQEADQLAREKIKDELRNGFIYKGWSGDLVLESCQGI